MTAFKTSNVITISTQNSLERERERGGREGARGIALARQRRAQHKTTAFETSNVITITQQNA